MQKNGKSKETVKITGFPDNLHDRISTYLKSELKAGATLYGFRSDGKYIARTKDGDEELGRPDSESE